jgi:Na+/melibiose symporter-like transporter
MMHYDSTAVTQAASVQTGLFNIAIFVPLVVFTIVFFIMLVFNRYEKKMPEIRAELAERRKSST